jgi:hypothetical protein
VDSSKGETGEGDRALTVREQCPQRRLGGGLPPEQEERDFERAQHTRASERASETSGRKPRSPEPPSISFKASSVSRLERASPT